MRTRKRTFGPRTKQTANMVDFGCHKWISILCDNTFSDSFVLDKALELVERPITNPIVHSFASVRFSYSFEVFHYNLVSVEFGNNVFTDVVVNPSHPTSFSSREFHKEPLARTSAYGLQFTTQMFEFPFNLFDFSRIIKPAVRTDSKVINSEVNAQNNVLRTNVLLSGSNLFGECEQEKASPFLIHSKQTFSNIPTEVFFVAGWDVKIELLPFFKQSQNQSVSFKICTSWEVVPNRCFFDYWFRFSFLDHTTCLPHTSDSNLGWKFEPFSDSMIYSIMEFKVLSNFMFPSIIDTELESFSVCFDSSNYLFSWIDSNFCSDISSHNSRNIDGIYKYFPSPPTAKAVGIRSEGAL